MIEDFNYSNFKSLNLVTSKIYLGNIIITPYNGYVQISFGKNLAQYSTGFKLQISLYKNQNNYIKSWKIIINLMKKYKIQTAKISVLSHADKCNNKNIVIYRKTNNNLDSWKLFINEINYEFIKNNIIAGGDIKYSNHIINNIYYRYDGVNIDNKFSYIVPEGSNFNYQNIATI